MKCWRCGQEINDGTQECVYCHADQRRSVPRTDIGQALRQLYDHYGAEAVLSNNVLLVNGLGDVVTDTLNTNVKRLKGQLKMAMDAGLGRLYKEQLSIGEPDSTFDAHVRTMLTEDVGLNDKAAEKLAAYFDEMIGWREPTQIPVNHKSFDLSQLLYDQACQKMNLQTLSSYEEAIRLFTQIQGYKDADQKAKFCEDKIHELKSPQVSQTDNKNNQKIWTVLVVLITAAAIVFIIVKNQMNQQNAEATQQSLYLEQTKVAENLLTTQQVALTAEAAQTREAAMAQTQSAIQATQTYTAKLAMAPTSTPVPTYTLVPSYTPVSAQSYAVGQTISFGRYEQDNNLNNGSEPILWRIIDEKSDQVLVISEYCLDAMPYESGTYRDSTWEYSSLRQWLRTAFYQTAFEPTEQNRIIWTTIQNPEYVGSYQTIGGGSIQDKIFLLGNNEVEKYLSYSLRTCKPTNYAVSQGAKTTNGYVSWWLRDVEMVPVGMDVANGLSLVGYDGAIHNRSGSDMFWNMNEIYMGSDFIAVRPAFWLKK